MFLLSVDREFCAAHALRIGGPSGTLETTHGHNFRLTVTIRGKALDQDGLLIDFHALERAVDDIIRPFINGDLNKLPPFTGGLNPSAEQIARHIGDRVQVALRSISTPGGPPCDLHSVRITEAPGCAATYLPDA